MSNDGMERISLLHEMSEMLVSQKSCQNLKNRKKVDGHADPQTSSDQKFPDNDYCRLSSYYGYVSREIALKHQIKSFGWESIKRDRCRKCFVHLMPPNTSSIKTKRGLLIIKCNRCQSVKRYKIQGKRKTHYERVLYDNQDDKRDQKKSSGDPETHEKKS